MLPGRSLRASSLYKRRYIPNQPPNFATPRSSERLFPSRNDCHQHLSNCLLRYLSPFSEPMDPHFHTH